MACTARKELKLRRELFCLHYIRTDNGVEAAKQAGYKGDRRTLTSRANELMTHPDVKKRVAELRKEIVDPLKEQARRVIEELDTLSFFDPKELFEPEGDQLKLKDIRRLGKESRSIKSVKVRTMRDGSQQVEVVMAGKDKPLELLGKHHALYTDKVEHSGNIGQVGIVLPDNGKGPKPNEDN